MTNQIKFGTSGWRAIISEDFTFDNVRLVTQAIADYVKIQNAKLKIKKSKSKNAKRKTVIVGYDTRFLSKEFADETAKVLSANGIHVLLSDRDVPTPVISYHIIKRQCAGGINFTASHNPPQYNGIKFSPETGGPASPDVTAIIERNIAKLQQNKRKPSYKPRPELIEVFDPRPEYLSRLREIVDLKVIKKANLKIAVDCMWGTSREYLDEILRKAGCDLEVLHDYLNPSFDGKRPEPAPENIKELISLVKSGKYQLGLATDGDADRFGIIDSDGTYITPNEVVVLLFYHLLTTRKAPGTKVARTLATTHMIDLIAKRHDIELLETPVGFKYFVDVLNSGECVIAGEESGGLSIAGHLPEKDGVLACLLIAEMSAIHRTSLKKIQASIYKTYGRVYSERINLTLPNEKKVSLIKSLKSENFIKFAGRGIKHKDMRDGCKIYLEDGSWVLFRPSGTEPIIRSYFEASSKRTLTELLKAGRKITKF